MGALSRSAVTGAGLALFVGAVSMLAWSTRLPDVDIRPRGLKLVLLGHTQAASPPGQLFRCERDGLHRIDVLVSELSGGSPDGLELVLREGGPAGEELRRVRGEAYEPDPYGGWIPFAFEPLPDSAGRELHFSLLPAGGAESYHVRSWSRLRGIPHGRWSWGEDTLGGPLVERELTSEQPDLRGLGFAFRKLQGMLSLVLFEAESGREVRRAEFAARAPLVEGWATLGFERLPDSRWKRYRYRLALPPGAELVAVGDEPVEVAWHGSGAVDPRLGGMTLGGQVRPERDLIFRAWTTSGPGLALARLRERMGWRLAPLVLAWLAASVAMAVLVPRARPGAER